MTQTNVLWIDTSVKDYQVFVDSVNPNTLATIYSSSTSKVDLLNELPNTIERIGIVFSHTKLFLGEPFFSDSNTTFFIYAIRQYQVKHIDFLACDTLKNKLFKDFFVKLHKETGVIVGASDNLTGNIKYGGDWILESTSEDIEEIYFTNAIQYYRYLLGTTDINRVSFFVKKDGSLWACGGYNIYNMFGINTSTGNIIPLVNVSVLQNATFKSKKIKQVIFYEYGSVVLMTDGTLWGTGSFNYTGIENDQPPYFSPIASFGQVKNVYCGVDYIVYLLNDGTLWGSGENEHGGLGSIDSPYDATIELNVTFTGSITQVACGFNHTVFLTTNHILYVTGNNQSGQLGLGDTTDRIGFESINILSTTGKTPELVACTSVGTIITMTDGSIWGSGTYTGIDTLSSTPYTFQEVLNTNNYKNGIRKVKEISAGFSHFVAIMTDNTLWGVGNNESSQLDSFSFMNPEYYLTTWKPLNIPVLSAPDIITNVYCGVDYTLLLVSNNTVYGRGSNDVGQLGLSTEQTNYPFFMYITTDVLAIVTMDVVYDTVDIVYNNASTICFPANTLVKCDQGEIPIQKVLPGKHTINQKEIVAITETYSMDPDMVCIEKDALRKNSPQMQTFISPRHKIYDKGKMKAAFRLVGKKGFSFVPYTGEKLYNVLLKEPAVMNVQGLLCETLHPSNPVAKHYLQKLMRLQ